MRIYKEYSDDSLKIKKLAETASSLLFSINDCKAIKQPRIKSDFTQEVKNQ